MATIYALIKTEFTSSINYSEVYEGSAAKLRPSLGRDMALIKWKCVVTGSGTGSEYVLPNSIATASISGALVPYEQVSGSWVTGSVSGSTIHDHPTIISILNDPSGSWYVNPGL